MSSRLRRLREHQLKLKARGDLYEYLWFSYHSKFFASLITHGRKATAFKFLIAIKESLKAKEFFDVYYTFLVAMMQITPSLVIIQRRMGASYKGIPFPLSPKKKITFAVKWIIKLLKDKNGSLSLKAVTDLLCDSLYQRGEAFQRKQSFHSNARKNRFLIRRFFR